jgi:hypothetical protein
MLLTNTHCAACAQTVRRSAVEQIRSIVARFPQRELEIRRSCLRDAHFRGICSDYEEATGAFRRWKKIAGDRDRRVEEYAIFLCELEEEILAYLSRTRER